MSKYVNPTGEGYVSTHTVRHCSVSISVGMLDLDWTPQDRVYAFETAEGVALVTEKPADVLAKTQVADECRMVHLPQAVCEALAVSKNDDVRVYQRDAGGLLLVDADDDPRVGGKDA